MVEDVKWSEDGMATYVDLDGVRTWYDEVGSGEPLVLMHPGGVDSRAFGPNLGALGSCFHTFLPERRGHGHMPDVDGPLTFEAMAEDSVRFIERVVGRPTRLVGYSDGAVVALLVARMRPDLVTRLVCVAGVFHHDWWLPEAKDLDASPPEFMPPAMARSHPTAWRTIRSSCASSPRCMPTARR